MSEEPTVDELAQLLMEGIQERGRYERLEFVGDVRAGGGERFISESDWGNDIVAPSVYSRFRAQTKGRVEYTNEGHGEGYWVYLFYAPENGYTAPADFNEREAVLQADRDNLEAELEELQPNRGPHAFLSRWDQEPVDEDKRRRMDKLRTQLSQCRQLLGEMEHTRNQVARYHQLARQEAQSRENASSYDEELKDVEGRIREAQAQAEHVEAEQGCDRQAIGRARAKVSRAQNRLEDLRSQQRYYLRQAEAYAKEREELAQRFGQAGLTVA